MLITKKHVFDDNFMSQDILMLIERIKELEVQLKETKKELHSVAIYF